MLSFKTHNAPLHPSADYEVCDANIEFLWTSMEFYVCEGFVVAEHKTDHLSIHSGGIPGGEI